MSKEAEKKMSDAEIQRILEETLKQYEVYAQLQDITAVLESSTVQEDYHRDMTHPLSIQVKG